MRLILPLLLVLIIALVIFLSTNSEELVSVNLGTTSYTEVHLATVIFIAFALGVSIVLVIAIVEGTSIRLSNHRLRRELHRLETEINFLRTQAPADEIDDPSVPADPEPIDEPAPRAEALPSAPVYRPDDDDPYART